MLVNIKGPVAVTSQNILWWHIHNCRMVIEELLRSV
jgi:hypothetical protein